MTTLSYGKDWSPSLLTVKQEELVSSSPLGPVHTLVTLTGVSTELSSVTEQVRLTAVPSYNGVELVGVMVRVTCGEGTDRYT